MEMISQTAQYLKLYQKNSVYKKLKKNNTPPTAPTHPLTPIHAPWTTVNGQTTP